VKEERCDTSDVLVHTNVQKAQWKFFFLSTISPKF
jgi:hypothetical protein